MKRIRSLLLRYVLPVAAFWLVLEAAVVIKTYYGVTLNPLIVLLIILVATSWYGGLGPGLAVLAAFEIAVEHYNPGTRPTLSHFPSYAIGLLSRLVLLGPVVIFASSRRSVEKEVRRQRESLQVTLSSIGDAVITTDSKGQIVFLNPVAESLTGWTNSEAKGKPIEVIFNIVNEKTGNLVESPVIRVIRLGTIVGLANHTILISKDNKHIPIDDSGAPIKNTDGEIEGVVLVFRDITERRRHEEEHSHLAAIVSSSEDAIIGKTIEGTITSWNRGAEKLYGYTAEEMIGRPVSDLMPPDKIDDFPTIMDKLRHGEFINHYETLRSGRDGKVINVSLTISPIRDESGDIIGASTIARDVTDRKRTEEENARLLALEQTARMEAEAANRAKDEFLAVVSHELRTPLNSILGWSRMLRSGSLEKDVVERGFESIERNARAQAQLVEDLLDTSRIISGKLRLDVSVVELSSVISSALDALRPAAEAKAIRLQAVIDPDAGLVSGDPNRLHQIVWNLVSNAVKFTPKGGRVQITLSRINSHAELVVSDTGKGIPHEFLPYVFDRFRQADSTITRAHGGLGLGLAIVRSLVELHGGSVTAYSDGEDKGSTFTVRLPILISQRPTAEGQSPSSRIYPLNFDHYNQLKGLKVLVVEDEHEARALLKMILEQCGSSVTSVASAREALETLDWLTPDIILSDIGMPGEDGYSLIKKIREKEKPGTRIPAVAVTAHASSDDRLRALTAGFQSHLGKPIDPLELVAVTASLVPPKVE